MRNKLFTLLTILVVAVFLIVGCQTVLNKTKPTIQEVKGTLRLRDPTIVVKGLEAKSLDEVLALPDDQIDLATAVLLISKRAHKDLDEIDIDIHKYRDRIDEMASALLTRMRKEKSPEGIVRTMNYYLFEDVKLSSFSTGQDPISGFLTFVLDEKKGNCLGLSLLYLSIAERTGLSLFGVIVPTHVFVRYEGNGKRINIETTDKGETASDDFYRDKFNIPMGSQFYLDSLGKKEMVGVFLNNVGIAYSRKGLYDQAISDYTKALEINPGFAAPYQYRGHAYMAKGLYDEAISDYSKAQEINPKIAEVYQNRGFIYMTTKGNTQKACSDFIIACELGLCKSYTSAKTIGLCQ